MRQRGRPPKDLRARQVFCVGLAKSGTHSIVEMLSPSCRAAHEPESEELLRLLPAARAGAFAIGDLRKFFVERDRRLQLDFEASHLLGSFVPHLVATFPRARFVLLVRECRAWIGSMINDQLNLRQWDGYARWRVVYDQYMGSRDRVFGAEESVLRELDLYPLGDYVRFWHDEVARISGAVPGDRLLVLRTEELASKVDEIARFLGVPAPALEVGRSHAYRATREHHVLEAMNPDYVEAVIGSARHVAI
jgi:hypothetical protein